MKVSKRHREEDVWILEHLTSGHNVFLHSPTELHKLVKHHSSIEDMF